MKKIICFFLAASLSVFSVCAWITLPFFDIGKSDRFSEKELKQAAELVKDSCSVEGTKLIKISFDQEASDKEAESYIKYGMGKVSGVNKSDVLVFRVDFITGGRNPVLSRYALYRDFGCILERDKENGGFKVGDRGYG